MSYFLASNIVDTSKHFLSVEDSLYIAGWLWSAESIQTNDSLATRRGAASARLVTFGHRIIDSAGIVTLNIPLTKLHAGVYKLVSMGIFPQEAAAVRGLIEAAYIAPIELEFKHDDTDYVALLETFGFVGKWTSRTIVSFAAAAFLDPAHALYGEIPPFLEKVYAGLDRSPAPTIVKLDAGAVMPFKTHYSDVGYDLVIIKKASEKGPLVKYNTGISLEIPVGFYVEIVPRSSLVKTGHILANSVGIIDNTYRGELFLCFYKLDAAAADLELNRAYCQLIFRRQVYMDFVSSSKLSETTRGGGGFGSTSLGTAAP